MNDEDRTGRFVETCSGTRFYPFDPRPEEVSLVDIAGALSHLCRFGGHCEGFYSVAEHSLLVSRDLADHGPRLQRLGLLHDAGEAYVGDVPRPIKARFDGFEAAERRVRRAVWTAFDIEPPTDEEWATVMAADDRLLAAEASHLLADGSWATDPPGREYDIRRDPPETARERFLDRARTLL